MTIQRIKQYPTFPIRSGNITPFVSKGATTTTTALPPPTMPGPTVGVSGGAKDIQALYDYINNIATTKDREIKDIYDYLARLYRSLSEESAERIIDFDILKLSNVAWYDVRNYASFASAITAIGATVKTLLIPNAQTVAADVTVPATLSLKFTKDGRFNIANGVTVTINGPIEAGLWQIFSCTGTGKVLFGAASIKEIYPQWWGAKGDGTTDDTVSFKNALTTMKNTPRIPLFIPSGNYLISDELNLYSGMIIKGANCFIYSTQAGNEVFYQTKITFAPTSEKSLFHLQRDTAEESPGLNYGSKINISDICIVGNTVGGVTYSKYAMYLDRICHSIFRNIGISQFRTGIFNKLTMSNHLGDIYIDDCYTSCFEYSEATDEQPSTTDVWYRCIFRESPWGGRIKYAMSIVFDNCLWESLTTLGLDIWRECTGITIINPYTENVPSQQGGVVWYVGVNGATTAVPPQAVIIGGSSFGVNYGTWLYCDYTSGIQISVGAIYNFPVGIQFTANTNNYCLSTTGLVFYNVTTPYTGTSGKICTSFGDKKMASGAAAPTAGTWGVGDTCWHTDAASAEPLGWYCTVAGTPGTWVAMANLA